MTGIPEAGEKRGPIAWMAGHSVAAGLYLYRLEAGDFTGSKKMLLLK